MRAVIVDSVRTAIGNMGGALQNVTADVLASRVIETLMEKNPVHGDEVDEVILGQAKQNCDISNIARVAGLKAGLSQSVPGFTVHRQCGSGLQAINCAVMQIETENSQIILAGGVESMSTAPYYVSGVRFGTRAGNVQLKDPNTASQPGSQPYEIYGDLTMGMTAENIAEKYGITREEQDRFALMSQERAQAAIMSGKFKDEIVPLEVKNKKTTLVFDTDEHPRDTSLELLGHLRPAFKAEGCVTAGNSSSRNDGAGAQLVMTEERARALGYKTGFRVVAFTAVGVDPVTMGLGPIPATKKALVKSGMTMDDLDVVELNEAFAAQSVAFYKEFGLELEDPRVNPNGGAIALGHPIGATGSILATKLFHEMVRQENARYGLVTLCIAGGMGIATIFEKVSL